MTQLQGQPGQRAHDSQVTEGNIHPILAAGQKQVAGMESRRPFQQGGDGLFGRVNVQFG